jgi:hypothetical protein
MSNGKPGKPAFLITREAKAVDPLEARQLLRRDNQYRRLDTDSLPLAYGDHELATYDREEKVLEIADDAVLLMIGNTDELVKAVIAAKAAGISKIRSRDERPLQCYFARIVVHRVSGQTDTLLAISSNDYYWGNMHHAAQETRELWHLPGLPNKQLGAHLGGLHERRYVSTEADDPGTDLTTTASLLQIVKGCKKQDPDGWIPAY